MDRWIISGAGLGTQDYHISVQLAEGSAIVRVSGEIDITCSLSFSQHLFAVLDEGPARVVVDLSGASRVDTTGLDALWESAKRCRLEGRELAIVCSEGRVRRALADTGLDQVVATHSALEEVLGHDPAT